MAGKQQDTFMRWINNQFVKSGEPDRLTNLDEDLKSGIALIKLMKVVNPASTAVCKKFNQNPKNEIHCNDNLSLAFNMIAHSGIKVIGTGPHDVYNKNTKLVIGMIWSIIYQVQLGGIKSEDGKKGGKDGLLLWCKKKVAKYDVELLNFTSSWKSGKALAALVHSQDEGIYNLEEVCAKEPAELVDFVMAQTESRFNIPRLMDVAAMVDYTDEKSALTYISEIYHSFSKQQGAVTKRKRVATFYQSLKATSGLTDNYESSVKTLMEWAQKQTDVLGEKKRDGNLKEMKAAIDEVSEMSADRRLQSAKLTELEVMLANIANMNKASNRPEYVPEESVQLSKAAEVMAKMDEVADAYNEEIRANYRKVRDNATADYKKASTSLFSRIKTEMKNLMRQTLSGSWEQQLQTVEELLKKMESDTEYAAVKEAAEHIKDVGISFDDIAGCVSWDELAWEWDKLEKNLKEKRTFLEGQVAAEKSGKVSADKVAEFQETFKMFDGDTDGNLVFEEFLDCINALGIEQASEDASQEQFKKFSQNGRELSFERFLQFMSDQQSDKQSYDQVFDAFKSMASNPDYITKAELQSGLSAEEAEFFAKAMQPKGDGFDFKAYLEKMYGKSATA